MRLFCALNNYLGRFHLMVRIRFPIRSVRNANGMSAVLNDVFRCKLLWSTTERRVSPTQNLRGYLNCKQELDLHCSFLGSTIDIRNLINYYSSTSFSIKFIKWNIYKIMNEMWLNLNFWKFYFVTQAFRIHKLFDKFIYGLSPFWSKLHHCNFAKYNFETW